MKIQANPKGSRFIEVTDQHFETIKKYNLFNDFLNSTGYIDEQTVEKIQRLCRQILESGHSDDKDLMNLCIDVIYHTDMKPLGLRNLMLAYIDYMNKNDKDSDFTFDESEIDDFISKLDFDFSDLKNE